ncbi:hypothetical protein LSH36_60g03033 [Paralvinella palmiformis]|uniref:G-protein coupled receptor n=1 Tax=Paralvinella palmiformis TaxID=53620 RepID=A0AAD9K4Q8_9ANNE|nr:hypothetical protein LSH36_60g03033 [Paralvinella palmiformis]
MDKLYILGGILGALTQCQTRDIVSRMTRHTPNISTDGYDRNNETIRSMEALMNSLKSLDDMDHDILQNSIGDTGVYATSRLQDMSNILQNLSHTAPANGPDLSSQTVSMMSRVSHLGYLIGIDMRLDESRRLTFPRITIYVSRLRISDFRGLYFSTNDGSDLMAIPHAVTFPSDTVDVISVWYSIAGVSVILRGLSNNSLGSDLIAVSFFDANGTEMVPTFDEHLFISVKVKDVPDQKQPVCAYLRSGDWATDGCDTVFPAKYDINRVECRCDHLTIFGIIFIFQPYVPHVGVAAMIGSGFTVFSCLITVLVFIGYRFSFLTALALAEIMYLCIRYTEAPAMCTMIAASAHFFATASFTWLLSYALFLGNDMIGDDDTSLHLTHYTFLGWAVPMAIVLISFIWRYDSYVHDKYCWISDKHGLPYAFVLPICFIIVGVMLFLIMFWFNEEVTMKLNHNNFSMVRFWSRKTRYEDPPHKGKKRTMEMTLIAGGFSPKPGTSSGGRKTFFQPSQRYDHDSEDAEDSPYLKVSRPAPIASSEDSLLTKDSDDQGAVPADVAVGQGDIGVSSTSSLLPESRS